MVVCFNMPGKLTNYLVSNKGSCCIMSTRTTELIPKRSDPEPSHPVSTVQPLWVCVLDLSSKLEYQFK